VPPFVPPELQVEEWLGSIEKMKSLGVSRLFLPHFGLVEGDLAAHFDALAERVQRWRTGFAIGCARAKRKRSWFLRSPITKLRTLRRPARRPNESPITSGQIQVSWR
jgi:hypothetical protein